MKHATVLRAPLHPASSADFLPREPLGGLQSARLRQTVLWAYDQVAIYRQRMHKLGLAPSDICGIDDIAKLPFTVRADLPGEYPLGMLAVRPGEVVRLHPAGAATGKPLLVAHTRRDLESWHEAIVRSLACSGILPGDLVLNASAYSVFADGLAVQLAAEALGATVIPSATGDAGRQIGILKDYGVSVICCTPSYFLYLLERAEKAGVDFRELPLRSAVFLAEICGEEMRARMRQAGVEAYELGGVPELVEVGVAAECAEHDGLHVLEDHVYPEVVAPESGQPVADGQEGELVLTALAREAVPLVRYRTGERAALLAEPCRCGRTLRRIRRIERRAGQGFAVEGVRVTAAQVEAVLREVGGSLPPYRIVPIRDAAPEQLELQVEVTKQIFRDQIGAMESLQDRLTQQIERALGVRVPVRLVEPHAIARLRTRPGREGKPTNSP